MNRPSPPSWAFAVLALALPAHAASGGAPLTLASAGRLLDAGDEPVSGTLALTFRIYDDVASPRGLEWEGSCPSVRVANGYYGVVLGGDECEGSDANGLDPTLDTSDVPTAAARWLELEIEGVTLSPRLAIATVPTAAVATRALSADRLGKHPAEDFALAASLAPVATSGAYADLSGRPALGALAGKDAITDADVASDAGIAATKLRGLAAVATSGAYADLSGTPSLSAVATSGAFADLVGRPVLGALAGKEAVRDADVAPDAAIAASKLAGLSAVAMSGAFADLAGSPVGQLTPGKWCTTDGSLITCTADPPMAAQASAGAAPAIPCSSTAAGAFWYDTSSYRMKVCNGTSWVAVYVVPGPPSDDTSTAVASPSAVSSNGTATSTVTVTVRDAGGNPVGGASVSLAATGTGNTLVQPGPTDANGVTTGTIASTVAEAKTVTVTVGGDLVLSERPTVTFRRDPPPGAYLFWSMQNVSGTTVVDESGSGNHGTLGGNAALVAGRAALLTLSTGTGHVAMTASTGSAAMTVSGWCKGGNLNGYEGFGNLSGWNGYSGSSWWRMAPFMYSEGVSQSLYSASTNASAGQSGWHHYVNVISGGAVTIYRDGVAVVIQSGFSRHAGATMRGFAEGVGSGMSNVECDHLRVYKRALTLEEVTALHLADQ